MTPLTESTDHVADWGDPVWITDVAEGGPEDHPPACKCGGPVEVRQPDEAIDHLQAICTDSSTLIAEACPVDNPCDCYV